jgi:hypothetical protein
MFQSASGRAPKLLKFGGQVCMLELFRQRLGIRK